MSKRWGYNVVGTEPEITGDIYTCDTMWWDSSRKDRGDNYGTREVGDFSVDKRKHIFHNWTIME